MDEVARIISGLAGTPTVLCVDDEKIILTSLQEQLRNNLTGIEIEIAESGEEGLEVLRDLIEENVLVPVVISDQLMPGMRGEEFLEKVHELCPETLNVLLTGQATADSVGAAVNRANLYRYIGKPWGEGDLKLTVREAIRAWGRARNLKQKEQELREAHEASLRFVPGEFLSALGKERLVEVREGHAVEANMQVVFADMRSFSKHAESLGSRPAFDLLNEYINILDTEFRAAGGFIAGLEGDGILALFPGPPADAVLAGIKAHHKLLEREQSESNQPNIQMGLAVHTGDLVLGTVGNSERLKCDVIGDPVNFCARLEGLTRQFDTPMIVSEDVAKAIGDDAKLRRIPAVQIKGREELCAVYEVLDALPEASKSSRLATLGQFDEAVQMFEAGNQEGASELFNNICDLDPTDQVTAHMIKLATLD
ncbi:response regulator [Shimia abyssi]|uniref:Class 3 adenylate cyclase n=1 Tax=Shimia abyssi TaxID=1662395 RepID=A0A2P8FFM2_9RHOB|nr:response regulator [Shimia abyssi]PSL20520.1 class 3 adenylate cyclase [Shimia abyssi]